MPRIVQQRCLHRLFMRLIDFIKWYVTTNVNFFSSVFELVEGKNYVAIPSESSNMYCMLAAKQWISKKNDEVIDIIFAYICNASEEDVEAAVFAKTGLRTPWIQDYFSKFMKKFKRKVGILTWELVPEAGLMIAEKEACLKAALDDKKKVRSYSFRIKRLTLTTTLLTTKKCPIVSISIRGLNAHGTNIEFFIVKMFRLCRHCRHYHHPQQSCRHCRQ